MNSWARNFPGPTLSILHKHNTHSIYIVHEKDQRQERQKTAWKMGLVSESSCLMKSNPISGVKMESGMSCICSVSRWKGLWRNKNAAYLFFVSLKDLVWFIVLCAICSHVEALEIIRGLCCCLWLELNLYLLLKFLDICMPSLRDKCTP